MANYSGTSEKVLSESIKALQIWKNELITVDDILDQDISSDIRRTVSSILFTYFRYKKVIDKLIDKYTTKTKPNIHSLFAVVLTQAIFQDNISSQSAVNIAVDHAKNIHGKKISGFVNAVLRNISREEDIENIATNKYPSTDLLPNNILSRWRENLSAETLNSFAELLTSQPNFTFRIIDKNKKDEILSESDITQIESKEWNKKYTFCETSNIGDLLDKDWLEKGTIYIQDPATVAAPLSIEIPKDSKILDLCAAPGGKSLILAEQMGDNSFLVASDRSSSRQKLTIENFDKFDHNVEVITADKLSYFEEKFDIILLDVPCSNTGVFRKRPDALWRFSEKSLKDIVLLQEEILESAIEMLSENGTIIYSTCSIEKEENGLQIENFMRKYTEFKIIKEEQIYPSLNHDGAYYAVLTKGQNEK